MRLLLALALASGLVLVWSGLSAARSPLAARVEPYLNGLRGRPAEPGPSQFGVALAARLARLLPSGGVSLRRRLAEAGSSLSVEGFRVQQATWMLFGACAGLALAGVGSAQAGRGHLAAAPALILLGSGLGFVAKDRSLSRRLRARRARVAAELPLALDLLTLSIMAGESVQAAFVRVAGAIRGEVGGAFQRCVGDIRAGVPTSEALERLPAYLPGPAVGRLVDSLCTGIERGAPLADTLRAQCDDMRDARRRELLEIGGRREILMLIPVVFLILPVVVAFALYPGLVALDLLVA